MSKFYGNFKMVTDLETVYADKVKELVSVVPEAQISAVYEFNRATKTYRPNESAKRWLCQQRGQQLPPEQEEQPNEYVSMFREMTDLMNEMGYTKEEREKAVDGFISKLPLKK